MKTQWISELSGSLFILFFFFLFVFFFFFFKHEFNLAESVIEKLVQAHKYEKEAILLTQGLKSEEMVDIRLLIESVRRIAEYASDISEVVLNMTVESVLS